MKRCVFFLYIILLGFGGCDKPVSIQFREYSKIVFLSNRDSPKGQFDIFTVNLDGTNQINHTENLQSIRSISKPVLSPDQKMILFIAFEQGKSALRIIDLERKSVLHLADVGFVPQASFSPEGDKILFVKKVDGKNQIYIINIDGSGEQNLSNNSYNEIDPVFSSDGSKISFVSNRNGSNDIWIMNADGQKQRLVVDYEGEDRYPSFLPDSKELVFQSYRNGSNNIYSIRIRGHSIKPIYESKSNNIKPQFSPDGTKILFLSNQRGMKYQDVFIYDLKGEKISVISQRINYINQNPKFSPDGKKVVFESIKFDDSEIYIVDADGGNLVNLTNHTRWDCSPSF